VIIIALDRTGRVLMTRDMELIRKIFLAIQQRKTSEFQALHIPDVDVSVLARQLEMLDDAGLIEAVKSAPHDGRQLTFMVKDLTWPGHDLASVLQNDTVWGKIKEKLSPAELSTIPLSVLKTVGLGVLEHYLKGRFGLP
jgi:DNA-binding HxlR family transcriptional regulator